MSDTTEAPSLEIVDIVNAIKIIDYACEQGAFKGWEVISQVNSVRTRLKTFADHATEQDRAREAAEAAFTATTNQAGTTGVNSASVDTPVVS